MCSQVMSVADKFNAHQLIIDMEDYMLKESDRRWYTLPDGDVSVKVADALKWAGICETLRLGKLGAQCRECLEKWPQKTANSPALDQAPASVVVALYRSLARDWFQI